MLWQSPELDLGFIGVIHTHCGSIGIMEKKMETNIMVSYRV